MILEIKGTIKRIEETVNVNDSFRKRTVVITVPDGEYKEDIGVEFIQDRVSILDQFKVGQEVECTANVSGRDWEKDGVFKNFVSLKGWKIEGVSRTEQAVEAVENAHSLNQEDDSLPF